MPENIIDLNAHRKKATAATEVDLQELMERTSLIEDTLEQLDELGVSTRDELVQLLHELEALVPETLD